MPDGITKEDIEKLAETISNSKVPDIVYCHECKWQDVGCNSMLVMVSPRTGDVQSAQCTFCSYGERKGAKE